MEEKWKLLGALKTTTTTAVKPVALTQTAKNENRSTKSQYLKPDSCIRLSLCVSSLSATIFLHSIFFVLFHLPPLNYVCMRSLSLSLSGRWYRRQTIAFHLTFRIRWCDMYVCVCALVCVRFYYKSNHSALVWFALLCFCLCECERERESVCCVLIKCLSYIFDTHLYSSGIFQVLYFIDHHFEYLSKHRKREPGIERLSHKMNVSFCYLVLFRFPIDATDAGVAFFLLDFQIEYSCLHLRSYPENFRFVAFVFGFWRLLFFLVASDASICMYIPDI